MVIQIENIFYGSFSMCTVKTNKMSSDRQIIDALFQESRLAESNGDVRILTRSSHATAHDDRSDVGRPQVAMHRNVTFS